MPSSAAPTVRRIQAAGDRLERLVAQLLRGTANDPRSQAPRLRPVGAAGLAYGLGRDLRPAPARPRAAAGDGPSARPAARCAPIAALVHEILTELIGNSAMFTPRGGTITLSGRIAAPGAAWSSSVADTGPGVPGEELSLVGERFGRGSGANGFPGAGLGLGVATALAERLGGRLTLEAGPAGRARLELPAAMTAPPEAEEFDLDPDPSRRSARSPARRSMRIAPGARKSSRPANQRRRRASRKPVALVEREGGRRCHRDPERQARPPPAAGLVLARREQRPRHARAGAPSRPPPAPRCRPRRARCCPWLSMLEHQRRPDRPQPADLAGREPRGSPRRRPADGQVHHARDAGVDLGHPVARVRDLLDLPAGEGGDSAQRGVAEGRARTCRAARRWTTAATASASSTSAGRTDDPGGGPIHRARW